MLKDNGADLKVGRDGGDSLLCALSQLRAGRRHRIIRRREMLRPNLRSFGADFGDHEELKVAASPRGRHGGYQVVQ